MDIIYKKNTLYVDLDECIDAGVVKTLESRVDNIMGTYNIENLVINKRENSYEHFHQFEENYNSKHASKVVIK